MSALTVFCNLQQEEHMRYAKANIYLLLNKQKFAIAIIHQNIEMNMSM